MTLELTVPPTIKVNRVVKNTNSCIRLYLLENTAVAEPREGTSVPPYVWTKLRPEGPKIFFVKTAPPYLRVWLTPPPPPIDLDPPLYGTERGSNGTDREMPSLALRICEFYHSYF